jgi:hypothetical protein
MKLLSKKTVTKLGGAALSLLWGCSPTGFDPSVEPTTGNGEPSTIVSLLTAAEKRSRSDAVKAMAAPRGITNPVVYAGVANHETGMAQCWSEATWACQGPNSSDCGGGPVIAGAGDGPCSYLQGGLGMYQFDAGTHSQTLATYGSGILTINGNISKGIDTILYKMQVCPNTRDFITSDAAAIAYLNKAKPGTTEFETYLTTMAWCYNGCTPTGCSAHNQRREDYRQGVTELLNLFGEEYWYAPQGDTFTGRWYLRDYTSAGANNIPGFSFGGPGDIPVVGDWNGDGITTIGVFRAGNWYLRDSNSSGANNIPGFTYGSATDIPLVGDWNGDGKSTIGVFRAGNWYLRDSNSAGANNIPGFSYGGSGDIPVIGDWNGDGKDTIGVFRNGTWYLRDFNSAGSHTIPSFTYGGPDDIPVVGDWDGDGVDTVGVVRNGTWYLRNSNSAGPHTITSFSYGSYASDIFLAGDWNGDGKDSVGVAR